MRTEEEILKDFEKMSYKIVKNDEKLTLKHEIANAQIEIYKKSKCYLCEIDLGFNIIPSFIEFQEHKLIHELFECWGWL